MYSTDLAEDEVFRNGGVEALGQGRDWGKEGRAKEENPALH